jgi:hypothetical protein
MYFLATVLNTFTTIVADVRVINLDGNRITRVITEGADAEHVSRTGGFENFCDALRSSSVSTLSIKRCELERQGLAVLAMFLPSMNTLDTLDLSENDLIGNLNHDKHTVQTSKENELSAVNTLTKTLPHTQIVELNISQIGMTSVRYYFCVQPPPYPCVANPPKLSFAGGARHFCDSVPRR